MQSNQGSNQEPVLNWPRLRTGEGGRQEVKSIEQGVIVLQFSCYWTGLMRLGDEDSETFTCSWWSHQFLRVAAHSENVFFMHEPIYQITSQASVKKLFGEWDNMQLWKICMKTWWRRPCFSLPALGICLQIPSVCVFFSLSSVSQQ